MRMITLASSGVDEPPQPSQVPPVTCHGFSLLIASHGLVAALTRAAFFGLEGPSSLLLFTTPGSCRRPHQGGFFWSGGSLLIAALYHPRVLSPPSPGRLFLVWRVPPHCCSLPPQGLVAALTRAAFFGLEGPSSLLLFTTPGSCRRPHQGGFFLVITIGVPVSALPLNIARL